MLLTYLVLMNHQFYGDWIFKSSFPQRVTVSFIHSTILGTGQRVAPSCPLTWLASWQGQALIVCQGCSSSALGCMCWMRDNSPQAWLWVPTTQPSHSSWSSMQSSTRTSTSGQRKIWLVCIFIHLWHLNV